MSTGEMQTNREFYKTSVITEDRYFIVLSLSLCVSLSLSLSVYVFVYLSVCLFLSLSLSLSVFLSLFLSLSLFVWLYICLCLSLFLSLSVYTYLCPSVWYHVCDYKYLNYSYSSLLQSYTIDLDKSKCYKMKTKSPMQQYCIPKNAKHTTELVFGAADDTLKGESWQFNIDNSAMKGQVATTVTTKDCIPIGELIFGKANNVGFMANIGFFNTTLNIRDPSVFKVPASCDDMDLSILISGRPKYAVQSNMLTRFGLWRFCFGIK